MTKSVTVFTGSVVEHGTVGMSSLDGQLVRRHEARLEVTQGTRSGDNSVAKLRSKMIVVMFVASN